MALKTFEVRYEWAQPIYPRSSAIEHKSRTVRVQASRADVAIKDGMRYRPTVELAGLTSITCTEVYV